MTSGASGTEPEARYRLEVLFDAYGVRPRARRSKALERVTERPTGSYAAVCASQPHPQTLRALGRAGVGAEQLEGTSFVGDIGNLGAASVGRGPRPRPRPGRAGTAPRGRRLRWG